MSTPTSSHVVCLFFFASVTFLLGCEEDLDLRDDFPEPFTLYGVLSPNLSTQYVRVYPIDAFPGLDQEVPEGIRFTSTDLATGEEIVWADTIDVAPNGQQDLVFKAVFNLQHEHVYRVKATRMADGASSFADVRIPPEVTIRWEDVIQEARNEAILDVFVEGERIRVLKPEITYHVMGCARGGVGEPASFTIEHHQLEEPAENGWHIPFNIWLDRLFVTGEYGNGIQPFTLILHGVFITFIVGDEVWDPPFGRFDINLLSHPEVLRNVQNGLGFVGAGYRQSIQFEPGCALLTDAEYWCPDVLTDDQRFPC